jgi:hypothetical protein
MCLKRISSATIGTRGPDWRPIEPASASSSSLFVRIVSVSPSAPGRAKIATLLPSTPVLSMSSSSEALSAKMPPRVFLTYVRPIGFSIAPSR